VEIADQPILYDGQIGEYGGCNGCRVPLRSDFA
jgi:hypothetical protein